MHVRARGPNALRDRIERLEGLPLRPASVRAVLQLAARSPGRELPALPPLVGSDPGWAVAEWTGRAAALGPLGLIESSTWWQAPTKAAILALDRLWKQALTAQSMMALRLRAQSGPPRGESIELTPLIADLGLWAIAAVDSDWLVRWFAAKGPEARRRLALDAVGTDLDALGRDLLERWGAPAARRLAVEADDRELAAAAPINDALRRCVTADVQARAAGGFVPLGSTLDEERLARAQARLLRNFAELLGRQRRLAERAARPATPPGPEALAPAPRGEDAPTDRAHLDALAEFAAGAAHELNNPLAVILGRAQLLLARGKDDAEQARSLRAITTQAQRAHRILRDLIYVARPSAPRPRCCVPEETLAIAVRDLATEAAARGAQLDLRSEKDPRAVVWLDPEALRHVADVLLRNALEVAPPGSTVIVNSWREPGWLTWRITDQGPGLTDRESRHLLDPFYCGRQAGRGLGLGLTRVARFVNLVGGRLRWWNELPRGTTFEVALPLVAVPELSAEDAAAPGSGHAA